jgi:adenine-specific DNA-methyltransferase
MSDKVSKESISGIDKRKEKLKAIFPEIFEEEEINVDKFKEIMDIKKGNNEESYRFTWSGKKEAIKNIQTPSYGSLIPNKDDSIDFDDSENLFIEGDNLEALKLLQKSYANKVKMIYIDPPYNTGGDFVYNDDFKDNIRNYLEKTGQVDSEGNKLTTNTESNGRFHSDWLSMMYPRLYLARNLLKEDGAICVSIGEEELANLKIIMNEIFGEENYRNKIIIRRYNKNLNRQFIGDGLSTLNVGVEFILIYSKSKDFKMNAVYREPSKERKNNGYWKGFWNSADRPTMRYDLYGVTPEEGQWKWSKEVAIEAKNNYQEFIEKYSDKMTLEEYWEKTGKEKRFIRRNYSGQGKNQGVEHWISPSDGILRSSNWTDLLASDTLSSLDLEFDNPKNNEVIKELIRLCTENKDIVLDFFAGSGTTAHAVLERNKEEETDNKFILVQLPEPTDEESLSYKEGYETISDIAKERIRRVIKGYGDNDPIDDGFKVFKLDKSNYKVWEELEAGDVTVEDVEKQLKLFDDTLIEGYREIDVIYEIIIKEGYSLNSKIKKLNIDEYDVYKIEDEDKSFYVTLEEKIDESIIENFDYDDETLFVCLDSALKDSDKINISLRLNLKSI